MSLTRLLVLLGLVAAVAAGGWLAFVPRRPMPDGPYAVGRSELLLRDSSDKPLPVALWYPAASPAGRGQVEDAPLAARSPAPLVLYSPGWGGGRTQSSIQAENLASHGFIVIGCDDYASDPAGDPDRGLSLDLSSDAAMAATIERAGRHAVRQARRLIDVLRALDAGQAPLLAGRVDLRRVGALGYSVGGSSVMQAALMEPRIVAVINVDGALFGDPADRLGSHAYLLISSREAFPSQAELASPDPFTRNYALLSAIDVPRNTQRIGRPDNYWILVKDADHADLSDALFAWSRPKMLRTNIVRGAMNAAIGAYEVAFFRSTLLAEPAPLRALLAETSQTVRRINSTPPPSGAASGRQ
ncbi:alpha/beta hydrolase [soil metagenome]